MEDGMSQRDDANSDEDGEGENDDDGEGNEEYPINNSGLLPPTALDPYNDHCYDPAGDYDPYDDIYELPSAQAQVSGRSDGQHDGQPLCTYLQYHWIPFLYFRQLQRQLVYQDLLV